MMDSAADAILALNAGSSSIKFALFESEGGDPVPLARGELEEIDSNPHLTVSYKSGKIIEERRWDAAVGHDRLLSDLLDWIENHLGVRRLRAVGHRIVHGGSQFAAPVRLSGTVIEALRALTPLAPLHQPLGLAPVDALARLRPELIQIACFDTAFHHHLRPPSAATRCR